MTWDHVYRMAWEKWGESQFVVLMEECCELSQVASKFYRGTEDIQHLAEEIADVEIMCQQMRWIYRDCSLNDLISETKLRKMARLESKLYSEQEKQ